MNTNEVMAELTSLGSGKLGSNSLLTEQREGELYVLAVEYNAEMPLTLDLRKNRIGTVWS